MKKIILLGISMLMVFAMLFPMVLAFEYGNPEKHDDTKFETFGPRCDNLLIQLYASETAEWAALNAGEIDVTDWPLDAEHYTAYNTAPLNATIRSLSYGPEFGLFLFDLNMNNNEFLGNPPDEAYPNPVYPNPMSCECLREAIAYLSDRSYVINEVIGEGFAFPVYTPMSPASGFYVHPEIRPGGALEDLCYLYDLEKAQAALFGDPVEICTSPTYLNQTCINIEKGPAIVHVFSGIVRNKNTNALLTVSINYTLSTGTTLCLESDAMIHVYTGKARFNSGGCGGCYCCPDCTCGGFPMGEDGWRYWDMNGNCVQDEGEEFSLKLFARSETPPRLKIAEKLWGLLENTTNIHVTWTPGDRAAALVQVMGNKDFHIYTAGWSLTMDPDHLVLWHWDFYWHPGQCYNTVGANCPTYNDAADGVQYANTIEEATYYAHLAQEEFAKCVIGVPLWSAGGNKAVSRTYVGTTGPEAGYTGRWWRNFINIAGFGVDNGFTFMSMRPCNVSRAVGGTIRYGFKTNTLNSMNPIYTNWLWDNTVIDLCGYESLLYREPYTRKFKPWLCDNFTIGTWGVGNTAINFTMRRDAYWSDGHPIDFGDIAYTFVTMKLDLAARGLPPPWWLSNVQNIVEFVQYSDTQFEIRLDVKSVFAVGWIGGNRIMPEHVWEPICTGDPRPSDGTPWDPTTFAPDANIIHSGVWCFDHYEAETSILFVANKPGTVVDTDITDANMDSFPVNSTKGFFRYFRDEDYNKDDSVNILDAIKLGNRFGAKEGNPDPAKPLYDRLYDINGDGSIDILDAIKLGNVFLWPNNELSECTSAYP